MSPRALSQTLLWARGAMTKRSMSFNDTRESITGIIKSRHLLPGRTDEEVAGVARVLSVAVVGHLSEDCLRQVQVRSRSTLRNLKRLLCRRCMDGRRCA